jgi:hypothetical protein
MKERCTLWEILKLTLLTNYRWVMAKYFHIMEVDIDKNIYVWEKNLKIKEENMGQFIVTLNIEEHKNIFGSLIYLVQDHCCKQGIEKVITKPNQVYILIG